MDLPWAPASTACCNKTARLLSSVEVCRVRAWGQELPQDQLWAIAATGSLAHVPQYAAGHLRDLQAGMASQSNGTNVPPHQTQPVGGQWPRQQHCKTRRRGVWAAALLCTAFWCSMRTAAAVQCSVFKPTGCWYTTALPESEEPMVYPRCAFRQALPNDLMTS